MDRPHCFQILTKERIYYLSIPSNTPNPSPERMNWVSTIRDGIFQHLVDIEKKVKPKNLVLASPAPLSTPPISVSSDTGSSSASATLGVEIKSKKRSSSTNTAGEATLSVEPMKDKEKNKTMGTLKKKKTLSVSGASTPERIESPTASPSRKRPPSTANLVEKTGDLTRVPDTTRKFKVVLKGQNLSLFKSKKKVASDTVDLSFCQKISEPSSKKVGEETYHCFKLQTAGPSPLACCNQNTSNLTSYLCRSCLHIRRPCSCGG